MWGKPSAIHDITVNQVKGDTTKRIQGTRLN